MGFQYFIGNSRSHRFQDLDVISQYDLQDLTQFFKIFHILYTEKTLLGISRFQLVADPLAYKSSYTCIYMRGLVTPGP